MKAQERTPAGAALGTSALYLFKVASGMLTEGDRLVADLGLSSSRWQVLDTIVAAERPQPVAWLARDMGANRQNVQRIVHDLARDGFVEFANNPHHRRAPLVMLTASGKNVHNRAVNLGAPWMNELARRIPPEDIEIMRRVLMALQTKLEKGVPAQQA
ncbi:MarR family winged helix-turn-helix transcriptional regulator [Ralstonia pseudosolanacearum]|uniref:MarR family winged helix-turn-helix transcriptional regulator n=1 Tax=Ralstonia pseudosolanacearum TaxID=1310165 RepID=UPI000B92E5A3|nr:MarR family winged helix-turn-helix transcriptional regulator [Ralstonia pseudosolanacearum]